MPMTSPARRRVCCLDYCSGSTDWNHWLHTFPLNHERTHRVVYAHRILDDQVTNTFRLSLRLLYTPATSDVARISSSVWSAKYSGEKSA